MCYGTTMINKSLILAGGCFWCVEGDLKKIAGVVQAVSGYTGGREKDASYDEVSAHATTHREAVRIEYDDTQTSYREIVQFFLDHIDPTDGTGQFADRGYQYEPVIYFENSEEKEVAFATLKELGESGIYQKPIAVHVEERKPFYDAEEYHQGYAEKNKGQYLLYKKGSGREAQQDMVCQIRLEKGVDWKSKK